MIDYLRAGSKKRRYLHETPLAWVAVGAVAGSSIRNRQTPVLLLTFVVIVVMGLFLTVTRFRSAAPAGAVPRRRFALGTVEEGRPAIAPKTIPPIVFITLAAGLVMGSARGSSWVAKWAKVERERAAGPAAVVLSPFEVAKPKPYGGKATFKARLYGYPSLTGEPVEVTIRDYDSGLIVPGIPVKGFGRFFLAEQAGNPGDFDPRRYLASQRIFTCMECSRIEGCDGSTAPWPARALTAGMATFRSCFSASLDRVLPADEASVLKAVLLADRSALSDTLSLDFRRSGFYRFVTIAGFHVDAMFTMVESALRKMTRRPTASRVTATVLACMYAMLSGWTPGTIRALTCAIMRAFAPEFRRRYYPLAGLAVSALISSWVVPFPLTDVGFRLTFAGASGSFIASRLIPGRYPHALGRAILAATRLLILAAFVFPVAAGGFSDFSVAGLALGGFWTGVATALIPLSFTAALLPWLGPIAGWLPYLVVKGTMSVSGIVSAAKLSSLIVPAPSDIEVTAYYGLIWLGVSAHLRRRGLDGFPARPASGQLHDNSSSPGIRTVLGPRDYSRASRVFGPEHREDRAFWRRDQCQDHISVSGIQALHRFWRCLRLYGPGIHNPVRLLLALFCAAVLFASAIMRAYPLWPLVDFISVGQGDCAVVRYRSSVVMVDTGTEAAFSRSVERFLRRQGIAKVDVCILSHLDEDHAGGLEALCAEVTVDTVLTSTGTGTEVASRLAAKASLRGWPNAGDSPSQDGRPVTTKNPPNESSALAASSGSKPASTGTGMSALSRPTIVEASPGAIYNIGGLIVSALCPDAQNPGEDSNSNSLIAIIETETGNGGILEFWGDAPGGKVSLYLTRYPELFSGGEDERIVKVPHHGSKYSVVDGFYERLSGNVAVVSVGSNNSYGHPSNEVLSSARRNGVRLLRTDQNGAVTVRFTPFGSILRSFR